MLIVPKRVLGLLYSANEIEIARLDKIYEECGDDWPIDFDANDIGLHKAMRDELQAAKASDRDVVELDSWKGLLFVIRLIPDYIQRNGAALVDDDVAALKALYRQCI